jgi:hypothetical protein
MTAIRGFLADRDPSEAKVRQAKVVAYLEGVWRALRSAAPVTLTRRQATPSGPSLSRLGERGGPGARHRRHLDGVCMGAGP